MPAAVLWLGNLLVGMVSAIVTHFALRLSKKTVFAAAAVAAFLALTAACIAAIKLAAVGIIYALPSWASGIGMLLPSNTAACIGAIVGAKTAVTIYRYNVESLRLASYIT